jgi:hypothetical protein
MVLETVAALGLASSIITIGELSYKIGTRTIEISKLAGFVPPEIQALKNLVLVIARCGARLKTALNPSIGPQTATIADLEAILEQILCTHNPET